MTIAASSAPGSRPATITTTYLRIEDRTSFRPAFMSDDRLGIIEAIEPSVPFYRFLYATVGERLEWTERLKWSDEQLLTYLSRPEVRLFVVYLTGTPVGYVELDAAPSDAATAGTEIAYLGVFPDYHGRGFGKHLLSYGVTRAYEDGANQVWLHTCSLDGPHALANYRARGFVSFRVDVDDVPEPAS